MKTFNAFIEEMMTAGTGGFTSAADAKGPVAGYDLPVSYTHLTLPTKRIV